MATRPIRAYSGSDPYVFICYAHSDADVIYPELGELSSAGIPVWYDEGIEPSTMWSDSLAHAIERCSLFVCYLSPRSARSEHCRREISFALDLGLKVLITVIEPTELSAGLKLMLGNRQMVMRHDTPPDVYWEKFCGSIGAALNTARESHQQPAPAPLPDSRDTSDRRLLTVLCADIVSDENVAWPDPEDWAECVQAFQSLCGRLTHSYEARVAHHTAEGVVAYFGHPIAHENDTERAVRCAMELKHGFNEVISVLKTDGPVYPRMRIAINSGPVVIEANTSLTSGPTPNLAQQMQELGLLDKVLISNTTRHLLRRRFEASVVGEHQFAGFGEPVAVYSVDRQLAGPNIQVSAKSPFVGRDMELAQLSAMLNRASSGVPTYGLICGEPGIGKSRLVHEFSASLEKKVHRWLSMQCSQFDSNSPFAPILATVAETLRLPYAESESERAALFEAGLERWGISEQAQVEALADVLGIETEQGKSLKPETAAAQRRLLIDALCRTLVRPGALTILHVEDVHWIDPSSQELLDGLVAAHQESPLLILMTARPEYEPPMAWRGRVNTINVERLLDAEVKMLVSSLAPDDTSADQLAARSDGIPLFAEALAESHDLNDPNVPTTLQELLYQQLDRLGEARATAQVAAVFGREFLLNRLQEILEIDPRMLEEHIGALLDAGLIFPGSRADHQGHYVFKHALVHELAYDSLLKKARREYHLKIAELLANRYSESTPPHELARHFSQAREHERAATLWLEAGRHAFKRSGHQEAVGFLRQGLNEVTGISDETARAETEITLQTYLGESLSALEGYASENTQRAFERARELSIAINRTESTFRAVSRLQAVALVQSHLDQTYALSRELQALAASMDNPKAQADADTMMGITAYRAGKFDEAQKHFRDAIAYHLEEHETGNFGSVAAHADAYMCNILWLLGQPETAIEHGEAALSRTRATAHAFNEAAVLNCIGATRIHRGEFDKALAISKDLEALAQEHNFLLHSFNARCLRGIALVGKDQLQEGIKDLGGGIDAFVSSGQGTYATYYRSYLAEAYIMASQLEQAKKEIASTLAQDEEVGVNISTSELMRLRAWIHHIEREQSEAEALLQRALKISDQQKARGSSLRIAVSWVQLAPQSEVARQVLDERMASFDQGYETRDLRLAIKLLNEASGGNGN